MNKVMNIAQYKLSVFMATILTSIYSVELKSEKSVRLDHIASNDAA